MPQKYKPTGCPVGRPKRDISRELLVSEYSSIKDWNEVAKKLKISRATLFRRIKELNLIKRYE